MANRSASVSRKITYAHIPKDGADGKTPVYDSTSNKWTYADKPTASQLTLSANRLINLDATSAAANTKAQTALATADVAKQTADSKVSSEEALQVVKDSLFFISRANGSSSDAAFWNKARLELFEDDDETWSLRVHCNRDPATGDKNMYILSLAFATTKEFESLWMDFYQLQQRVAAIEKRLGIS